MASTCHVAALFHYPPLRVFILMGLHISFTCARQFHRYITLFLSSSPKSTKFLRMWSTSSHHIQGHWAGVNHVIDLNLPSRPARFVHHIPSSLAHQVLHPRTVPRPHSSLSGPTRTGFSSCPTESAPPQFFLQLLLSVPTTFHHRSIPFVCRNSCKPI